MVGLVVNGDAKASSEIAPGANIVVGLYQISLNTLVKLEANDNVEIRWIGDGDAVLYSQAIGVHWTGMYLESSGAHTPLSLFPVNFICVLSSIGSLSLKMYLH